MRLFIAVKVEPAIASEIARWLAKVNIPGKKVSPENFHLTLCFLGERPESEVLQLNKILLKTLSDFNSFSLSFKGIGVFPHLKEPRVLYLKIHKGQKDLCLVQEKVAKALPFYKADKSYAPHLTLSRLKENVNQNLAEFISQNEDLEFGEFTIKEVTLFSSDLRAFGPVYKALVNCSLVD